MIRRAKAVVLVAQSLREVAALDLYTCQLGWAVVPAAVGRVVAFRRVWCLVSRSLALPALTANPSFLR